MSIAVPAVSQDVDIAANALGRVTVVACSVYPAGGVDVEALGIDRGSYASCPGYCGFYGLGNFVKSDDEDDLFGSPGDCCHTVAIAVNIDDDTIFRYSIGTCQVYVCSEGFEIHLDFLFGCLYGVSVKHIQSAPVL